MAEILAKLRGTPAEEPIKEAVAEPSTPETPVGNTDLDLIGQLVDRLRKGGK
jgi:hypothetical protein